MSDLKMREEFEAWAKGENKWYVDRNSFGDYIHGFVRDAWSAWQASRAAVVIELPDPEIKDRPTCVEVAMDCCKEAIEAAGLQVKR